MKTNIYVTKVKVHWNKFKSSIVSSIKDVCKENEEELRKWANRSIVNETKRLKNYLKKNSEVTPESIKLKAEELWKVKEKL